MFKTLPPGLPRTYPIGKLLALESFPHFVNRTSYFVNRTCTSYFVNRTSYFLPSLRPAQNVLPRRLPAIRFRAGVMNHVALPVQAGDEHRPAMVIATRLVGRKLRRLSPLRSHVSQPLAEAAPAELRRAAEEINAIVRVIRRAERLHRPKVLVTKRQNVAPHHPESSIPGAWQAEQVLLERRPRSRSREDSAPDEGPFAHSRQLRATGYLSSPTVICRTDLPILFRTIMLRLCKAFSSAIVQRRGPLEIFRRGQESETARAARGRRQVAAASVVRCRARRMAIVCFSLGVCEN